MKQWTKYIAVILSFVIMANNFLTPSIMEVKASDTMTISGNETGGEAGNGTTEGETGGDITTGDGTTEGETGGDITTGDGTTEGETGGDITTGDGTTEGETGDDTGNETSAWSVTVQYELNDGTDATGIFATRVYTAAEITGGYEDMIYIQIPEEKPAHENYSFDGWSCNISELDNGCAPGREFYVTREEYAGKTIIFSAIWKCITINMDFNGGNRENYSYDVTLANVLDDNAIHLGLGAEITNRPYHRLTGWLRSNDNTVYAADEIMLINWDEWVGKEINIIAQWEELPIVNITYQNSVSDNSILEKKSVQQYSETDTTFNLTLTDTKPEREDYRFNGWVSSIDNSIYPAGYVIENLNWSDYAGKNITFTAEWIELPSVTVEFVRHDDKVITESIHQSSETEITFELEMPIDDSEYKNYEFAGWLCNMDGEVYGPDVTTLTLLWEKCANQTITFTAVWEEMSTVTINYVDESGIITDTKTIQKPGPSADSFLINLPEEKLEREGYLFGGWSCSADGCVYEAGSVVENLSWEQYSGQTIFFTEVWRNIGGIEPEEKIYTVYFDCCDGSEMISIKVTEGEKIAEPVKPIREGYIFEGWYLDEENYDFNIPITEDITLTAKWKAVEPPEPEPEIQDGKEITLSTGVRYYLGDGNWTVNSDGYTYSGNHNFYVTKSGDYTFTLKSEK